MRRYRNITGAASARPLDQPCPGFLTRVRCELLIIKRKDPPNKQEYHLCCFGDAKPKKKARKMPILS